jgi:hypothetical protein
MVWELEANGALKLLILETKKGVSGRARTTLTSSPSFPYLFSAMCDFGLFVHVINRVD